MKNGKLALLGWAGLSISAAVILCCLESVRAAESTIPMGNNYYSAQHPDWPPSPANIFGLPEVQISPGVIVLLDEAVDYNHLGQQMVLLNALESALDGPPEIPGSGESGGGGGGFSGAYGGRTLPGTCSGYLLPPVYQTTNLVLTLANVGGGENYDLFTAP